MTASREILWRFGASMVTDKTVQTRFATVSLSDVDRAMVSFPLLAGAAPLACACTALSFRFRDVLTTGEFLSLIGFGWLGLIVALLVAQLTLFSYSIKGHVITLPVWRALPMRRAVDVVLAERERRTSSTVGTMP